MANNPSARKRVRINEEHRQHNAWRLSMMRTEVKKVTRAIRAGDKAKAQAAYSLAMPLLDRMAGKGLIHRNKAARHKSRLSKHIKSLG